MDIRDGPAPNTRRRFLGQVGTTLAAAVGFALVPGLGGASTQERRGKGQRKVPAATWSCCVDCVDCSGCGNCSSGFTKYFCTHQTPGCDNFCTGCTKYSTHGNCYIYSSPVC
jgi:hypothetical protein